MEHKVNYIKIMIDSLQKKVAILDEIIIVNEKQATIIIDIKKNMVEYESILDEKQLLIDALNTLDDGFQALYNHVQDEIKNNSEQHKENIKEMQRLIGIITDRSVEIQTGEEKNRAVIAQQFSSFKREVKKFEENRKIASQYYNTMQKTSYITPQFLDKKN